MIIIPSSLKIRNLLEHHLIVFNPLVSIILIRKQLVSILRLLIPLNRLSTQPRPRLLPYPALIHPSLMMMVRMVSKCKAQPFSHPSIESSVRSIHLRPIRFTSTIDHPPHHHHHRKPSLIDLIGWMASNKSPPLVPMLLRLTKPSSSNVPLLSLPPPLTITTPEVISAPVITPRPSLIATFA